MTITIVPEDGGGNSEANSYTDVDFVDQYHADRGNVYWSTLDADSKAACMIRSTDYIDKRFKRRFRGQRQNMDQALAWPRIGAFDDDGYELNGVPVQVQKALAEYALRAAIYNVLAPDPTRTTPSQDMSSDTPNGDGTEDLIIGPVRSKTEKVGPLEESTTYDSTVQIAALAKSGGSSRAEQSAVVSDIYIPMYPEADLLLEELFNSSVSVELVRA